MMSVAALQASGRPVVSQLFTDNMVFQQLTDAPVWGQSKAGKKITVTASWDQVPVETVADASGHWMTRLHTPKAGGPYTVTVSDGQKLVLKNVMVGEVWLCSGQSNMEMPIDGWAQVNNYEEEKQEADQYPHIRLLQVGKNTSPQPLDHIAAEQGGWQVCSAASVKEFSATAYFFGRYIHRHQQVPVGLINASWGGTFIEPWISAEALRLHPDMQESLSRVTRLPADKTERQAYYDRCLAQWKTDKTAVVGGYTDGQPAFARQPFESWPTMTVPVEWERDALPDFDGVVWMLREVQLPAHWAGKPLTLSLGRVDDLDFTCWNGREVGQSLNFGLTRRYTVPGALVKAGRNVLAVSVVDTGGGGGIYSDASELYVENDKGERLTLAGPWHYKVSASLGQLGDLPVVDDSSPNQVTVLYNAMIHPLVGYAVRGAIWYQGCNNWRKGYQYRELLPLLIRDWRARWGYDFPFYIVQLANYMPLQTEPGDDEWAEVREAQAMAAQHVEHSGLACLIDIGEAADIHPRNKQEVGRRLALVALAKTYGEQSIAFSGPVYAGYQIEGRQLRILFDHADGLCTADGRPLEGFAIAGSDRQWHWGEAVIDGRSVVVSCPDVEAPVAVRYAWHVNPLCNLYNAAGLPAVPFRTDDWPGLSVNNHWAN